MDVVTFFQAVAAAFLGCLVAAAFLYAIAVVWRMDRRDAKNDLSKAPATVLLAIAIPAFFAALMMASLRH